MFRLFLRISMDFNNPWRISLKLLKLCISIVLLEFRKIGLKKFWWKVYIHLLSKRKETILSTYFLR